MIPAGCPDAAGFPAPGSAGDAGGSAWTLPVMRYIRMTPSEPLQRAWRPSGVKEPRSGLTAPKL